MFYLSISPRSPRLLCSSTPQTKLGRLLRMLRFRMRDMLRDLLSRSCAAWIGLLQKFTTVVDPSSAAAAATAAVTREGFPGSHVGCQVPLLHCQLVVLPVTECDDTGDAQLDCPYLGKPSMPADAAAAAAGAAAQRSALAQLTAALEARAAEIAAQKAAAVEAEAGELPVTVEHVAAAAAAAELAAAAVSVWFSPSPANVARGFMGVLEGMVQALHGLTRLDADVMSLVVFEEQG